MINVNREIFEKPNDIHVNCFTGTQFKGIFVKPDFRFDNTYINFFIYLYNITSSSVDAEIISILDDLSARIEYVMEVIGVYVKQ